MNRKEKLEARKAKLEQKKADLLARSEASEDVEEVRAISDRLRDVIEDIKDIEAELIDIAEENGFDAGKNAGEGEAKSVDGEGEGARDARSFNPLASFGKNDARANGTASMEYRHAFKAYVQRGVKIPANLLARAKGDDNGSVSTTEDLGAIIPVTIMNEFINEVEKVYGQIYSKVRKLNIRGGVKFPISDLSAEMTWINESTVAPSQSAGTINEYIEFSYNIAEIRVRQTLLSSIVALDLFEREIVRVMTEAYVQAMDKVIIHGTGVGQPLGVLKDPRVTGLDGHSIALSATDINNWTAWRKNLFAKLPLGRRSGEFVFPVSTVETYLLTMADANNNPIFREATGLEVNDLDRSTSGRFFGREVTLVEPDVIPDFDTAASGDVIGLYWQPKDYAINTNLNFGMKRWFDEDRNQWVNKALTIVDGKMLNVESVYLLTKK